MINLIKLTTEEKIIKELKSTFENNNLDAITPKVINKLSEITKPDPIFFIYELAEKITYLLFKSNQDLKQIETYQTVLNIVRNN
jgi:hypothetical protein